MTSRAEAKTLIARQIATNEGRVWDRLDAKAHATLNTLAENLIATVERKMREWKW